MKNNDNDRLIFLLCVTSYAMSYDRQTDRCIAGSVVGEASRIKIDWKEVEGEHVEDLAREYVTFAYDSSCITKCPEWIKKEKE